MLQLKRVPDELHALLRARAEAEGISMSDYVIRLLREDLARPTPEEWLEMVGRNFRGVSVDVDSVALLDEFRGPWP